MSWYNPKIYCKEHLHEDDRTELDSIEDLFKGIIYSTEEDLEDEYAAHGMFGEIIMDFVRNKVEKILLRNIGYELQELMIGKIESYPEDEFETVYNPTWYNTDMKGV